MTSGYRILDTNILTYSLLEDHPASYECQKFIESESELITSSITLIEIFFILTRIYGIDASQAWQKISELASSPLQFPDLKPEEIVSALHLCKQYRIDTNDGLLLQISQNYKDSILITDDHNLTQICNRLGLRSKNPISDQTRELMHRWEENNLPKKGLPRILYRIWNWINERDQTLSTEFRNATQDLTRLP